MLPKALLESVSTVEPDDDVDPVEPGNLDKPVEPVKPGKTDKTDKTENTDRTEKTDDREGELLESDHEIALEDDEETEEVEVDVYADGTTVKPFFRGVLHLCTAPTVVGVAILAGDLGKLFLCLGLAIKTVPYLVSAWYHRFPFAVGSRWMGVALLTDLVVVPLALAGSAVPFVSEGECGGEEARQREIAIGGAVLLLNAALAVRESDGIPRSVKRQRTHIPRLALLLTYTVWVITRVGVCAGLGQTWRLCTYVAMVILILTSVGSAYVLSVSSGKEPLVSCVPWHRRGIWSAHEDMHLLLLAADGCWLALSV